MKVKIITTGGTIAKKYDEISGELLFDADHLEKILTQARVTQNFNIENLYLKDSLEFSDKDREVLLQSCLASSEDFIMITHGTDTMVESATKLSCITDKTIVFVGAMIPYAFKHSDALFNIGAGLGAMQSLQKGIYIVMNGEVFSWDNVYKDKKEGVFKALN